MTTGTGGGALASARVVGTGSIGTRYLRVLRDLVSGPLIAVPIRGSLPPTLHGMEVDLEEVEATARPTVDLTVIATRTGRHVSDALDHLPATRALLIEKPVAESALAAQALSSADAPCPIAVVTPLRFMAGFAAVQAALPALGTITSVSVRCRSWLPDWRPGTDYRQSYSADPVDGGVLRDLVHEIDYALRLFGMPSTVSARLQRSADLEIPAETTAALRWGYVDFPLLMDLDVASRSAERVLDVRARRGRLIWDLLAGTVTVHDPVGSVARALSFPGDLDRDLVLARQVLAAPDVGHDDRVSGLAEAIAAVGLCDAARASDADGGTPVALPSDRPRP